MKPARFACWILFLAAPLLAQSTAVPPINQNTNVTPRVSTSPSVSGGHDPSSARQMRSIEQVLYTFTGGDDGGLPVASLIFDGSGNLYGASAGGGDQGCGGNGCGVVFELSPNSSGGWSETVLYRFTGGSDGGDPQSSLIFDSKGNLFGVTQIGGSSACTYSLGCGTVFELTPNGDGSWTETTIYSFVGGSDGQSSNAGLVFDNAGNLYGTTFFGGIPSCYGDVGCGTVFELTPSGAGWTETVLYRFNGGNDGAFLRGGLISDGVNLYGTTEQGGGTGCYGRGCGTVFEMSPSLGGGWTEALLYSFTGLKDGAFPESGLIINAGNLVGTTGQGGDTSCNVGGGLGGCGTVFELYPSEGTWGQRVLYGFTGGEDGSFPLGGVVLYQSSLYGMTYEGGGSGCFASLGCGTVYELSPTLGGSWTDSVLYGFSGSDGEYPMGASLIFDESGNLYGTTENGGSGGWGNVFEVTPLAVTTTVVSSSANPSKYGQSVTFTATVTSQHSGTPTGTVSFFDRATSTNLGSSSLNNSAMGSVQFSTLGPSTHSIAAAYSGDTNFASSVSSSLTQVVLGAAAKLLPTSLTFDAQTVGTPSSAQTISLKNTGDIPLTFNSITFTGTNPANFHQTNNCGSSLAGGATCTFSVSFKSPRDR